MPTIKAIEDAIEKADWLIKASEPWSGQYGKDPGSHAKIIKIEAKLERKLRGYFRDLASRVPDIINWNLYAGQVTADFNVDVLIEDDMLDDEEDIIMGFIYDPVRDGIYTGADAGQKIYKRPLGITPVDPFIDQAAKAQVAGLVGRKVSKSGIIVDNPSADYAITETTRNIIRESIATSVSLKETYPDAIKRLSNVIADPSRAATIAATESVNAYQIGLHKFGEQSGAVAKEWESLNSDDVCGENADAGIIDMADDFPSGDSEPVAHPNCRCSLRLVYPEELDN